MGSIIRVYEVEKEKTFYLKFEQGFISKTHKLYFPISHTHTFYKPCVLMLYIKFQTHTYNLLHMFTCEPKTVQVQQNLSILFCLKYTYICVSA